MSVRNSRKEQRFTELYNAFVDEVYGFLLVRTGFDTSLAEDLTQEVFLAVFRGLEGFAGKSSLRTWVFCIARNKLNDFYRSRTPESCGLDELDTLSDHAQDINSLAEKSLESEYVRSCLEKLPLHYQTVLVLKYLDDFSTKQIAQTMGLSTKAAESLLHRAKAAFIKEYGTEER